MTRNPLLSADTTPKGVTFTSLAYSDQWFRMMLAQILSEVNKCATKVTINFHSYYIAITPTHSLTTSNYNLIIKGR